MKSLSDRRATAGENLETLTYCYGFNLLLLLVVGHGYLSNVPPGTSVGGWTETWLAFVSNSAMLALIPALLTSVFFLARRQWVTLTAAVILFGLLNVFIYADYVIFQLWRIHFNGMVWNLITSPGASDAAIAGTSTKLYFATIVVLIYLAEIGFAIFLLPRVRQPRWRTKKAWTTAAGMVCLVIFADKMTFNIGDLRGNVEVLRVRQLFPLYQGPTTKRLMMKVFGVHFETDAQVRIKAGNGSLNYPKAPPHFRPDGPRPNILIIPIEGGRVDMLTPDVMPFLSRWATNNIVFENNYSAGNTTRYGVFGLLYGIYGTYWSRAAAEHTGPALIKALKTLGYRFRALCSADMNYAELQTTSFVDIQNATTDRWNCERVDRDWHMTDAFLKFLDDRSDAPFFGFLFYDASHQPYQYPAKHAVFDTHGVTDDLNYIKLANGPGEMESIKNRYKNAMHYVDGEIARTIGALEERGLLTNTLVFVMGDHGEEFRELGLFGHNSSFNRYQTKTLMVAHIPGQSARHVTRLTSHIDVSATIFDYLGIENPPADYTQGLSMLSTQEHPFVFISSWDTAAIFDGRATVTFGTAAYKVDTTIFDENYSPLPNQRDALAAKKAALLDALAGMHAFMR